jgi:hypothetical protein
MKRSSTTSTLSAGLAGITAAAILAAPAAAHHSFAMYDRSKTETLTGKITRFIPGANHAQILFELVGPDGARVMDEDGAPVIWGFETGPAARIARAGVTVGGFPVGTIITVNVNPLRDGRTFGVLTGTLVRCGTEMPEGGCNEETGEVFNPAPD